MQEVMLVGVPSRHMSYYNVGDQFSVGVSKVLASGRSIVFSSKEVSCKVTRLSLLQLGEGNHHRVLTRKEC